MYIREFVITNFRGIKNLRFDVEKGSPIVLIGENGSGKSSTLDCMAILLSQFAAKLRNPKASGRFFTEQDINIDAPVATSAIALEIDEKRTSWSTSRFRSLRQRTQNEFNELRTATDLLHYKLEQDAETSIPIAVYYPTNRSVLDIPLRIRTKHSFQQIDAYEMALTGGGIAFRRFFEWFRAREDIENEQRIDKSSHRDKQLAAVRNAITTMRPEYSNLRVRRNPLRMIVTKSGQELEINMLSDGEKCLLALVGDLARRLAIANPGLKDALQGKGIVLIDEVELHLHPRWQREIIPSLVKCFPMCQFIITTHSPQVISDIHPENVYILGGDTVRQPESSFGRDSNRILEDVMGVSERPRQIQEELLELFRLIDDGNLQQAKSLLDKLTLLIGYGEPLFAKANIMIGRQKALAK